MTRALGQQNQELDDFYLVPLAQKIKFYPSLNLRDLFLSELCWLAVAESFAFFAAVFLCLIEFENSEIIFSSYQSCLSESLRVFIAPQKNRH